MNDKPNRQIKGNAKTSDGATKLTTATSNQPSAGPEPTANHAAADLMPALNEAAIAGSPAQAATPEGAAPSSPNISVAGTEQLTTSITPEAGQNTGEMRLAAEAASEGLSPEAWRYQRHNFRFGVANGIIFSFGDALSSPGIVVPYFISQISNSNLLVGLAPAISTAGSLLPQLFIASRVQHIPQKMPWYANVGYVRAGAIAGIGVLTLLLSAQPALLLPAFFTLYAIYSLGNGVSGIPWMEIVGKTVPPRRRGMFFGLRSFWGGMVALVASTFVSFALSQGAIGDSWLHFPNNFALLYVLTALFYMIGILAWRQIKEPSEVANSKKTTIWAAIKLGPQIIREDKNYRAFLTVRLLLSLAAISDPFYVIFAKNRLGAPAETLGLFMAAATASGLASNLIWSPLPNKMNPRALMMLRVVSGLLTPLSALVLPPLLRATGLIVEGQQSFGVVLFAIVFAISGFAGAGANIVNNNMLLELAPPAQRPLYIGFMNTILGLGTLVPIIGGSLIDRFGFEPVFALSVVIVLIALFTTRSISNIRKTV